MVTALPWRRYVIILILLFSILRLLTAATLELGNDEAYYWLYSRDLQWNYFDHPPMIALWVRLSTLNGLLDQYEVFVRLGSIISCAFATWFLFRAVSLIQDEKAGWLAACLFNASLYTGLIAGLLVMPDAPQLFFWTLALWQIAKLLKGDHRWSVWIWLGIAIGLCTMSKVHGVFLWFGLGLFILFQKREWLKKPQLYVALLISVLLVSPVFFWNLHYDFVTWRFHSERVDISEQVAEKENFWLELLQQIVINNPVNFVLILLAFLYFRKRAHWPPALIAYNYIALPLALILLFVSIFRDIWFHWSGPAYTTLLPLAGIYLSQLRLRRIIPVAVRVSTALFILTLAGWPMIVHFYPGTYGNKQAAVLGSKDVTLDKYGWEESGASFAHFYRSEVANGQLSPQTPIVCPTWWGAHVEYYFAKPAGAPVIGLGAVNELHHYAWLNQERLPLADMDTAYCIVSSIEKDQYNDLFKKYYRQYTLVTILPVERNGKPAAAFYVYRLSGWKGEAKIMAMN